MKLYAYVDIFIAALSGLIFYDILFNSERNLLMIDRKKQKLIGLIFAILCLCLLVVGLILPNQKEQATNDFPVLDLSLSDESFYLSETNYTDTMITAIEPFIDQYKQTGYLSRSEDISLYYEQYLLPHARAQVAIAHGFTESSQKYKEVIYYFLNKGFNVHIIDHRGHGYSSRLASDPSLVHIVDFNDYVLDFKAFMDEVVLSSSNELPTLLYAHSMGGGMSALFLEQYPDYFDGAVLSSPMMAIDSGNYPQFVAQTIASVAKGVGLGEKYILGQSPYNSKAPLDLSTTSSIARASYMAEKRLNDEALQLGGGSFAWLNASFKATHELTQAKNASKITTPTLVFQSEADTLVLPEGHYTFLEGSSDAVSLMTVPYARHELYMETNEILIPYFNAVFSFYEDILDSL